MRPEGGGGREDDARRRILSPPPPARPGGGRERRTRPPAPPPPFCPKANRRGVARRPPRGRLKSFQSKRSRLPADHSTPSVG